MAKLLLILIIGLIFESIGVVCLKKGIVQVGGINQVSVGEMARLVKSGATNAYLLLGVFCEALFFASLVILMGRSDVSLLWPLTGLSFVFATFAAMWFLHEQVSFMRWVGVVCIMIGVGFISYSEHAKPKAPAAAPAGSQPAAPQTPAAR